MAVQWGAIGSIIGGLGGLFSSKKGAPSARENIMKLAQGSRQASDAYGFNPLTLLGAGAGMGGGGGGGGAPLASIDLIVNGLKDISDETSGDAARRRKAEELELDLARIKLDQARAGVVEKARPGVVQVVPSPRPVAAGVGAGPSPLGRRAATIPTVAGTAFANGRLTMAGAPLTASARPPVHPFNRPVEMIPVRGPDGVPRELPKAFADKLDIKPFGTIMMGDMEELRGDTMGEITMAPHMPDVLTYEVTGKPASPSGRLEFDKDGKKWVPPFTDPKSESWWKRPLW